MQYQFVEKVNREPSLADMLLRDRVRILVSDPESMIGPPRFEARKQGRVLYIDVPDEFNPVSYRDRLFKFVDGFGYEPSDTAPSGKTFIVNVDPDFDADKPFLG